MAVVELIFDVKSPAWVTGNTNVPKNGEPIFLNNGSFAFGDGVTQVQALTFFSPSSGAWGSITGTLSSQTDLQTALNGKQNTITTGTTAQYFRGDLSLATFPTNVSSFTNDSGYITSSALSPYLTSANAASTYQPIGSYLTGLTVGSTAIGSGTNTRILYNNGGVLGEYLVTGTGTTAVLSTSPTISTSLTVTTASTTNVIRDLVGTPTASAIYLNQASPSATNYVLMDDGSSVYLNGRTSNSIYISLAATNIVRFGSNFQIHTPTSVTSGSTTTFAWTKPNNTGQAASTNIPGFLLTTGTRQWATGAISLQEEIRITSPTYSFVGASTITNAYTLFVNSPTAGTNATITNNYALGLNGALEVSSIIGGSAANQTLTFKNTTGIQSSSGTCYNFLAGDGSNLINIVYRTFTFSPKSTGAGAISSFIFKPDSNVGQTASTEINGYLYTSYSRTWQAGAITTQRERYYKTVTYAFASASTITNAYGAYFEAPTAGTNATITNNYAAGFSGNVNILSGELRNSGTKVVGTRDTGWTAFTNTTNKGTSYDTATVTLQQLAERVAALQAALTTHGLLGV